MSASRDQRAVPVVLAAVALASVSSLGWLVLGPRAPGGGRSGQVGVEPVRAGPGPVETVVADVVRIAPDRLRVALRSEDGSLGVELDQPLPDSACEGSSIQVEGREVGKSRFGSRYLRGKLSRTRSGGAAGAAPAPASPAPASPAPDRPAWSRSRLGELQRKARR